MAEADWTAISGGLSTSVLRRGVTSGLTPPSGGGSRVYGFNSATSGVVGAAGLIYDGAANFNPTPANTLGSVSGALVRLTSSGTDGFAPFLFLALQADDPTASAYLLGLQEDDPASIVLVKGALEDGLPSGIVGESGILRKSVDAYDPDEWVHLRLDATVQGSGDVLIQVFENDLDTNDVTTPVWSAIDGMSDFVDDALGVNSGSLPLTSGSFGFACQVSNISRRAAFDHLRVERQL